MRTGIGTIVESAFKLARTDGRKMYVWADRWGNADHGFVWVWTITPYPGPKRKRPGRR